MTQGKGAATLRDAHVAALSGGYPVYSASQRILRFVSLLYLGWYILIAVFGLIATALHLLFGFEVYTALGAVPPTREVAFANAVVFIIDTAFNLCVAVSAWMAANHPVIARRFRIFAGILVALSLATVAYAAFFGQLANVATNLYSLFITGLLFYLSTQIARERETGTATDFADLILTPSGKRLRTERQVQRAVERGEIPTRPVVTQTQDVATTGFESSAHS